MTSQQTSPDRFRVGRDEIAFRVTSEQSGGALLAAEVSLPAGGGPPMLHRHAPEEVYRVERGEVAIYLEDERGEVRRLLARPGSVVHIPGGRAHTVRNESGRDAYAYVVFTPGAEIERFLRAAGELAADGEPGFEQVLALAERHGIAMAGPVPAEPKASPRGQERKRKAAEAVYDAVVVGARCAGSPTAMLLARAGHRVLLVDRASFPSDTISTHFIHPPGVARLARWGLQGRLEATGCPPVERYSFDFGPITIAGSPRPTDGVAVAYGPRRTVLDKLLVDAAAEAGAEVHEGVAVEELLADGGRVSGIRARAGGGRALTAKARVVIGADGRHSTVAKAVRPEQYNARPPLQIGYYAYWSGLPVEGFETFVREGRGFAALPTHDDLTLVVVGWPYAQLQANRGDIEGNYVRALELAPEFAERVRTASRESRFAGTAVSSYFRTPYGPGWALVGDAGYDKDPITAWGISDAFRDAELATSALDQWLSGSRPFEDAMPDYQRLRDEQSLPMFELTCAFATMAPPPPEMQRLLAGAHGNQAAMDDFVSAMAGTLPVHALFGAGDPAVRAA